MKAMTKRLLSALVVLAMVLSMVPVVGLPAIEANAAQAKADITEAADALMATFEAAAGGNVEATCPACSPDTNVTWQPLTTALGTGVSSNSHYYLPTNLTSAATTKIFQSSASGWTTNPVCLHLNGKTLTTAGGFTIGNNIKTILNVMGQGNVKYTGTGNLYTVNTAQVYLWGGTHSAPSGTVFQKIGANGLQRFFGNTVIDGVVKMGTENGVKAQLYLNNNATIKTLQMGNTAYLVINANWNGTIYSASVASRAADGTYSSTYVYANNFTGAIFSDNGEKLIKSGSTVAVDANYSKETFAPASNGGWAWCEACNNHAKWTTLESALGTAVPDTHYYLASELTDETATYIMQTSADVWGLNGHDTVCLNLNGKTLNTAKGFSVGNTSILNVIANGGTINYTGTGTTAGTDCMFRVYTAKLYLYGGTYNTAGADIIYNSSTSPSYHTYIYDADINGSVVVTNKNKHYIYGSTSIADFQQTATTGYVEFGTGWSGTIDKAIFAAMTTDQNPNYVPAANAVLVDGANSTGKIYLENGNLLAYDTTNGYLYEVVAVETPKDVFDLATYHEAWCEACDGYIPEANWTAVHAPLGTTAENGKHYYIADDFTDDGTTHLATTSGSDTWKSGKICLHLNGQEIQTAQGIYVAANSTINIMGSGKITYSGTENMIASHSGTIYLYGGTYSASNGGKILYPQSGYHTYMYNDAKLEGLALLNKGTLHLYDDAQVDAVETHATNVSLLKLEAGWTGSVGKVTIGAALTEGDGVLLIPTSKATVVGTLQGTLTLDDGAAISQVGNTAQLQAAKIAFNPTTTWNNRAYCPVCKTTATWSGVDTVVASVANGTSHMYLTDSVEYSSGFFMTVGTGKTVHFNMNGHNITATDGTAYGTQVNGTMDMFNTSATGGIHTGGSASYGGMLVHGTSANFTLRENVTLKAIGGTTSKVVLYINYGTVTMLGGTVTAVGAADGTRAVLVGGRSGNTAYFTMEDGEIIGSSNCAVQVGNSVTDAKAEFVMNGGTITGGTAANGGSLLANGSYCKKLELLGGIIQDGNATNNGGNVYIAAGCAEPVINGVTIQSGEAVNGGNLWLGVDTTITKATISGGEATTKGGNVYALGVDLTIEANATIENGTVGVENATTGYGGGNIFFGQGTLTTSGTITGGKAHAYNGAGGNIFLDNGQTVGTHFIMNGGEISGGQLLGHEDNGSTGQAYGANIRAYRVTSMEFNAGTISGGIGGADNRAHGRDVFISTASDLVTNVTIGTGFTLTGAYYQDSNSTLTMVGAPQIGGAGIRIGNEGMNVKADVSGLTSGASINLNSVVAGDAFTTATATEPMAGYFHVEGQEIMWQDSCLWIVAAKVVNGETTTAYTTFEGAAANVGTGYIQMGYDATVAIPADTTYTIDANGHNITVTGEGTLQAMDSSNKDFEGNGIWTITGVIMEPVTRNDGDIYVLIVNEDFTTYSAHYLDIRISAVNLRTSSAGLYYTAEYKCDATLAANIRSYGVGLSVHNMPANELDPYSSYTSILTNGGLADKLDVNNTIKIYSGAVTNIFTNDAENAANNAENAATMIYANAYLEIDTVDSENTYVFGNVENETVEADQVGKNGDGAVYNMGKVLEAIDAMAANGATEQVKTLIMGFCQKWTNTFAAIKEKGYSVQNIINLATNA